MTEQDIERGIALRDRIKVINDALLEIPNYRRGLAQTDKDLDDMLWPLKDVDSWHVSDAIIECLSKRLAALEAEFEAL